MRGSLDELFTALRAEGVPVGPAEVVRTRHALACAPRLDRDGLRRFLGLLLVKRPEHQATFDWLFDLWCPDLPAADWLRAPGPAIGGTGVRADVPARTVTGAPAAQPPEQTPAAGPAPAPHRPSSAAPCRPVSSAPAVKEFFRALRACPRSRGS